MSRLFRKKYEKRRPFRGVFRDLAAAVVAAAATVVAAVAVAQPATVAVAAATEQDQQDDDPAHIPTAETVIAHTNTSKK